MPTLQRLNINTQKDEIIARLLLQRYYGIKDHGMYSNNEIDHVLEYTTPSDQEFYCDAFEALEACRDGDGGYKYLVANHEELF